MKPMPTLNKQCVERFRCKICALENGSVKLNSYENSAYFRYPNFYQRFNAGSAKECPSNALDQQ